MKIITSLPKTLKFNERLVLSWLHFKKAASQRELASKLSLTRKTASSVLTKLRLLGLIDDSNKFIKLPDEYKGDRDKPRHINFRHHDQLTVSQAAILGLVESYHKSGKALTSPKHIAGHFGFSKDTAERGLIKLMELELIHRTEFTYAPTVETIRKMFKIEEPQKTTIPVFDRLKADCPELIDFLIKRKLYMNWQREFNRLTASYKDIKAAMNEISKAQKSKWGILAERLINMVKDGEEWSKIFFTIRRVNSQLGSGFCETVHAEDIGLGPEPAESKPAEQQQIKEPINELIPEHYVDHRQQKIKEPILPIQELIQEHYPDITDSQQWDLLSSDELMVRLFIGEKMNIESLLNALQTAKMLQQGGI